MSKLLDGLDQVALERATNALRGMRADYPAYRDDELLLALLAMTLTPGSALRESIRTVVREEMLRVAPSTETE